MAAREVKKLLGMKIPFKKRAGLMKNKIVGANPWLSLPESKNVTANVSGTCLFFNLF